MLETLNLQEMKRIAQDSYAVAVDRAFHVSGGVALRELLEFLLELYTHIAPENISGTLYIVRRVSDAEGAAGPSYVENQSPATHNTIDRVPNTLYGKVVIEVGDRAFHVWQDPEFDESRASESGIVYRYSDRRESFIIKRNLHPVRNPAPIHASVFSRPTFSSLREALLDYRDRMVRTSFCYLFRSVWQDDRRLFLKPRPEWLMRRSLHQFLMTALRDAEVRPEQVVDESHPIDLKVTWTFTTRDALIEIKWLGKSRVGRRITADHTEVRARQGAKQLAEYLDSNRQAAAHRFARGYLVIIDARRRNLKPTTTQLSRRDGMYYERKEITYHPEYHKIRDDFDPPIRMFVEPVT
jgi:hypothetical protein